MSKTDEELLGELDGISEDLTELDRLIEEVRDRRPFVLKVQDREDREWTQQELWDGTLGLLRDRGVDVARMVMEQALRASAAFGFRRKTADNPLPAPWDPECSRLKYQMDVQDFDCGTASTEHVILVLRSRDPGHGFHQPVFGAVFQDEWSGLDDPEKEGARIGYGRDVLSAVQALMALGPLGPETAEGDLAGKTVGAELPRETVLEAALIDAYGRIEELLEERDPVLRKAEQLILSVEKRETIAEDWHPFFDAWLRTFAEWAARMGRYGHLDAAHIIRSLFSKLSGFEAQQSPDPVPQCYPMIRWGVPPPPDQDRPETKDMGADHEYWQRRKEAVLEDQRRNPPRMVRDKSVTHEVVTRFNLETGYVAWRAHRVLAGDPEELDVEAVVGRILERLQALDPDGLTDEARMVSEQTLARAERVICEVMAGDLREGHE